MVGISGPTAVVGAPFHDLEYNTPDVVMPKVLGSALAGKCKERPELVGTEMPLSARLSVVLSCSLSFSISQVNRKFSTA